MFYQSIWFGKHWYTTNLPEDQVEALKVIYAEDFGCFSDPSQVPDRTLLEQVSVVYDELVPHFERSKLVSSVLYGFFNPNKGVGTARDFIIKMVGQLAVVHVNNIDPSWFKLHEKYVAPDALKRWYAFRGEKENV